MATGTPRYGVHPNDVPSADAFRRRQSGCMKPRRNQIYIRNRGFFVNGFGSGARQANAAYKFMPPPLRLMAQTFLAQIQQIGYYTLVPCDLTTMPSEPSHNRSTESLLTEGIRGRMIRNNCASSCSASARFTVKAHV
jgi:hypothetical protein